MINTTHIEVKYPDAIVLTTISEYFNHVIRPEENSKHPISAEITGLIQLINEAILNKNWNNNHYDDEATKDNWYAIRLPHDKLFKYDTLRTALVQLYQIRGWDCFMEVKYDNTGSHYNFYLSKKHFFKHF